MNTTGSIRIGFVFALLAALAILPAGAATLTVGGGGTYATIQAAVDASTDGDIISVAAGTYIENVYIDKALTFVGPNAGKAGNDPTRGPEAVVMTFVDDPEDAAIFAVRKNGIVIDGFLFNGDNPSLNAGYPVGAADANAAVAIQNSTSILLPFAQINNLVIQNNIFTNFPYDGIYLEVDYNSNQSGNYIRNNKFATMWEGVQVYAMHMSITNNVFEDVGRGLSVHSVAAVADPGFLPLIANNTISIGGDNVWYPGSTRGAGIWINFRHLAAPALLVTNNVVNTPVAATGEIVGILLHTIADGRTVTLNNNSVNGTGNCDVGLQVMSIASDSVVTVSGGTLAGITDAGIRALTFDAGSGAVFTTNPVYLTVSGVALDVSGTGIDIVNPTDDATKAAVVTVQGGTTISNGTGGVAITGAGAQIVLSGGTPLKLGNLTNYFVLASNGSTVPSLAINATAVEFDGKTGAEMTGLEPFAVEDKVTHKVDNAALGLVTWKTGNVYVTPTSGSISAGLVLVGLTDLLNIGPGSYPESVLIDQNYNITGVGTVSGATFTIDGVTFTPGGLLYAGSTFVVTNGASINGTGTVGALAIMKDGHLRPGTSPGILTVAGNATFGSAGIYDWDLDNVTGTAGTDWDLVNIGGQLNITALAGTPFTIKFAGAAVGFNQALPYTWKVAGAAGGITGFALNNVILDLTFFPHIFGGEFFVLQSGNDLVVQYIPGGAITVTPPGGGGDFFTIQGAVNAASPGGLVLVAAGTYEENVFINKALTLRGPNVGKPGNDPTRGPEARVIGAVNDPEDSVLFALMANNIVVDGFMFDGDNPALPLYLGDPDYQLGAADANTAAGVQNGQSIFALQPIDHLTVQNNLFKNFPYQGVYFEVPYLSNHSENYILNNKFDTMWEGVQAYAMHTVIDGNVFTNVGRGLSVHSVAAPADPGFAPRIANNIVDLGPETVWYPGNPRAVGIWINFRHLTAPALLVTNNVVNTPFAAAGEIIGILLHTIADGRTVTLGDNSVNGGGNCDVGLQVMSITSDSTVTVSGGTLAGITGAGIRALTYDAGSGAVFSTNSVYLTINGVVLDVTGTGIDIVNPTADLAKLAVLTVQGSTTVSNALRGFALTGQGAQVAFVGAAPAMVNNVTEYLVHLSNGSTSPNVPIDATAVLFDGKLGSAMTEAEGFATEDKVVHKLDNAAFGLVTWFTGNYFVTPASGSIQRGVDVTAVGQTLHVNGGTYAESVLVDKQIAIVGPGTITGATITLDNMTLPVAGSLYAGSSLVVNNGAILNGVGTVGALTVSSTGNVVLGVGPGTILVATNTTFANSGIYDVEINDATGTAGANPGWDWLNIGGQLNITAVSPTPFVIKLTGTPANFNPALPYSWKIATAAGGVTGFSLANVFLDTTGFNPPPVLPGKFLLVLNGNDLVVQYFPTGVITVSPPGDGGDCPTIQCAVDASIAGGLVLVYPGTYIENVYVWKPLTLRGPNFGKAGNDPTRGPEAIVMTAINDPEDTVLFSLEANNIIVDGFLFEGNNPAMAPITPEYILGGGVADANVAAGIQNGQSIFALLPVDHLTIQNNVFQHLPYDGIYLEVDYLSNHSWNYIRNNKFDTMWEGLQLYALHAAIESNVFENVGIGLSIHGVAVDCDPGFVPVIASNSVTIGADTFWKPTLTRTAGIWVNYRRYAAPALLVTNNVVNTPVASAGKEIAAFQIQTVGEGRTVTLLDNTVNGANNANVGLFLLNTSADSLVTWGRGLITGVIDAGVRANTSDSFWGEGSVYVSLDNTVIGTVVSGAGVEITAANTDPTKFSVVAIKGGTIISNAPTGILLSGQNAQVSFPGATPASLSDLGFYLVEQSNGATVPNTAIDATAVLFDGKLGSVMTEAEGWATEDKITHKVDNTAMGLVTWYLNNIYVTAAVGNIQNGIVASLSTATNIVEGGSYTGDVNVTNSLTLSPGGSTSVGITVAGNLAFDATAVLQVDITGSAFDQLVINGTVTLGNATLTLTQTGTIPPGTNLVLIANDGADAVSGQFIGLPEGTVFVLDGRNFTLSYQGGDGNDVALSAGSAPVLLDTVVVLNNQDEDSPMPVGAVGTLVSQLVDLVGGGGQNNVTDSDAPPVIGMAVIGADTASGSWFFTTNGGVNWAPLGSVAINSARLLAADALTRVYFVPNLDFNGTIASALTFRAWDLFAGANGEDSVDTTVSGGATPFSAATDTAALTIDYINDRPVPATDTAPGVVEDTVSVFAAAPLTANDAPAPPTALDELVPAVQTLTVTGVLPASLHGGAVSFGAGNITYTPPTNFNGVDIIYYLVTDDGQSKGINDFLTATGMVSIVVTPDPADDIRPYFFSGVTNFPAGLGPHSIAVADFDGDFTPDLAVANYKSNTVTFLKGSLTGQFSPLTTVTVGTNPAAVVTADFNNDLLPDLAVANDTSNSVTILINMGGSFAATHYPVGSNAFHLAMGQLNGDVSPDLAVVSYLENKVDVLTNDTVGGFALAASYPVGSNPVFVAIEDLNTDGFNDLVVANSGSNSVSVLLGGLGGVFTLQTNLPVGPSPSSLAVADVNSDTKFDLIVANQGDDTVSVLLGDGLGGFAFFTNYAVGDMPSAVLVEDMNHDGLRDVVVANEGDDSVWVLIGNGAGAFTNYFVETGTAFAVGDQPVALAVGLFNNDLDPDIAVANFGSDNISILLNSTRLTAYPQSITIAEDAPATNLTLTGWGSPISFVIVQPPTLGVVGGGPLPNLTYTVNPAVSGVDSIGFVVTDGMGNTSPVAYVTITIVSANDPPSFDITMNPVILSEDAPLTTIYNFATNISVGPPNEAGQIFRFITSNNFNGLFSSQPTVYSSGALILKPAPNMFGTATVTVWMQDNGGTNFGGWDTSTGVTFTVIVTNVNDAPQLYPFSTIIQSRVIYEHGMTTYKIGVRDYENPASDLTVSVASTNQVLVPTGGTNITYGVDGTGTNLLVNVWPSTHEWGRTLLVFTVSDGTNSTSRSTILQVNPLNDQPSFTLSTNTINWSSASGGYTNAGLIATWDTGDYKETTQGLYFWIVNTNQALFSSQPYINTVTRSFSFKPKTTTTAGSVTLDVFVRDNGGGTNYQYGPLKLTINLSP